jgi:hypothetical protein
VWLVTPDRAGDARRLGEIGLRFERPVTLPRLGGRGFVYAAGRGHVVLVAPVARGRAADALGRAPARIFAVSIAVADLGRARRRVERGYGKRLETYAGLWGRAFEAPADAEIGLAVEFHASAA